MLGSSGSHHNLSTLQNEMLIDRVPHSYVVYMTTKVTVVATRGGGGGAQPLTCLEFEQHGFLGVEGGALPQQQSLG